MQLLLLTMVSRYQTKRKRRKLTKNSPTQLLPHRLLRILGASNSFSVLNRSPQQESHTFLDRSPCKQLVNVWLLHHSLSLSLLCILKSLQELTADLISHTLELGIAQINTVVLAIGVLLQTQSMGFADRVAVVGGDDGIDWRKRLLVL